jgi:hypothetical protein
MSGRSKPSFEIVDSVDEDGGISLIIAFTHALPGLEVFEGLASDKGEVLDLGVVGDEHFIAFHTLCSRSEVTGVFDMFVRKDMRDMIERIGQLVNTYCSDN